MSKLNPEKALRALLPRAIPVEGTNEEVRPLSLATFAVLDEIASPMLRGGAEAATPLSLLPTLYVLCRGAVAALESANLLRDATAWAEALPPSALGAIRAAAQRQLAAFADVVPTAQKKTAAANPATTAGSSPSPSSPPSATAGRGAPSSTSCRPAPSRC